MKKAIFTLNVGNQYCPEICKITYPLMRSYAEKIGAQFRVITERQFPSWPVVAEKLQLYHLGREFDWVLYADSDALIHPEFFDVTAYLSKDTVLQNKIDIAGKRFRHDVYFLRDARHIGSCNWFTVASNWCLDLWKPMDDMIFEEAVGNISLTLGERQSGLFDAGHLIDDYVLSRNIARYGLKFRTLASIQQEMGDRMQYLWHEYLLTTEQKIEQMKALVKGW